MLQEFQDYQLKVKVSSNDLSESWIGYNTDTRQPCFLKTTNLETNTFSTDFKNSFLNDIYSLQKKIHSTYILSPRKITANKHSTLIEYPLLDKDTWQTLTPEILTADFSHLFPRICFILDLLHEHKVVHCDIKLDNFLYNHNRRKLVLTDLEFISQVHAPANALIKGTSKYISPDILKNENITTGSDYYALGVIVEEIQDRLDTAIDLTMLIDDLKNEYINRKYELLTDIMYKYNLVSDEEYKKQILSLLSGKLLSDFLNIHKISRNKKTVLKELLSASNNILGFNDEIIELLGNLFDTNRRQSYDFIKYCISKSHVKRTGEFYLIYLHDELLVNLVSQSFLLDDKTNYIPLIDKLNSEMKFLSGFAVTVYAERDDANYSIEDKAYICGLLADYYFMLNRFDDSMRYLLKKYDNPDSYDAEYYHFLVRIYSRQSKHNDVIEVAKEAVTKQYSQSDQDLFVRSIAWTHMRQGEYDTAERMFADLLEKSDNDQFTCLLLYSFSVLYWYRSKIDEAIDYSRKCLSLAQKNNLDTEIVLACNQLCVLYSGISNYTKAFKIGKLGLKHIKTIKDNQKKNQLLLNISYAAMRLGKWSVSKQYLLETLKQFAYNDDTSLLESFYLNNGILHIVRGQHHTAKQILNTALRLNKKNNNNSGKVYYNLHEIAVVEGDSEAIDSYFNNAKQLFQEINQQTPILEMEVFQYLGEYLYGNADTTPDFLKLAKKLEVKGQYYIMGIAYFLHCFIALESNQPVSSPSELTNKITVHDNVPLFKAVKIYNDISQALGKPSNVIFVLKEWLKIFHKSHYPFFSGLICRLIGKKYLKLNNNKLGEKFLEYAQDILSGIGNQTLVKKIEKELRSSGKSVKTDNTRLQIIKDISELLTNIQNYDKTLEKILRFSLEQTGAERAVLLSKHKTKGTLQIKAYLNCDENSLEDIEKFSSSVTQQVYREDHPLIIDDAQQDDRISGYKSIIKHNIQSVICIPIKHEEEIIGVLYLDHQIIPALFDRDDIIFSFTLANLLSMVLTLLDLVKNQKIINKELIDEVNKYSGGNKFISNNEKIIKIFERLPPLAKSNSSILLLGESGTGKEILADLIHNASNRANKPLVKINCTSIPENLVESELFGIEANVATGVAAREGKLSRADSGTMFIDEIGDMPLNIQTKILRVIEYQEFEKVGGSKTINTDIRFIYATNKDLKSLIKQNKFRLDLYHRIYVIPINIPPLKERLDDIPLLIDHFVKHFSTEQKSIPPVISSEAEIIFEQYNWPGNVRELKNLIERFCIMYPGQKITLQHIPDDIKKIVDSSQQLTVREIVEKTKIRESLEKHRFIESRAAQETGIPLSTFRRKRKKYNI